MSGDAADDEALVRAAKALPLPERLVHANWRVRVDAYADVVKEAGWAQDGSTPPLRDFGAAADKVTSDGNPNALDAGLDALNAFLAKADEAYASRCAAVLASNLVVKGLTARPKTVTRASDALLLLVELDAAEATVARAREARAALAQLPASEREALLKGLQGKVPKGVAACVAVLVQAVKAFGPRVVKPSPVLKACGPLFDHKDKAVRDGAKELAVELTRWLGAAAVKRDLTDKMRDAQKKEVDEALEAVAVTNAVPTRFLRKDPARLQANAPAAAVGASADAAPAVSAAAPLSARAPAAIDGDMWDVMEPEDILPKLSRKETGDKLNFFQGTASEKWKDRVAAFAELRQLASAPRLAPGDYVEVVSLIKKAVTKDANAAVVAEAVEAAATLATGLRRDFRAHARMLTAPLLDKFKDKNSGIVRALHSALAAFSAHCYSLLDVTDDIAAALEHKVPAVQVEALTWLAACLSHPGKPAKLDKALVGGVLKSTEASTPAVRDAGLSVLAVLFRSGGDVSFVSRAIDSMDPARKKRLQSLLGEAGSASAGADAARPLTAPAPAPAAAPPPSKPAPGARPASAAAGARPTSASSARTLKPSASLPRGSVADDDANYEASDVGVNAEDIAAAVDGLVGGGLVARLSAAEWKERLEAVTALHAWLAAAPVDTLSAHCETITRQLANAPGWEERNLQVVAKNFEILELLARNVPALTKSCAMLSATAVVSKMAEVKLKTPAADLLTAWAEALGPRFVAAQMYKRATAQKNPKVLELALGWWSFAMEEFGGRAFDVRATINAAKDCMSHANPGVKAAAVKLLGAVHAAFGPAMKAYIADLRPALMSVLENEFLRCPYNPALMDGPRAVRASKAVGGGAATGGAKSLADGAVADAAGDGLPRDDISALFTPKLIKDLGSAEWKARQAALESVEAIINEAGRRIAPTVGPDIMPALKGRLSDANKMLVIAALRVIALLAEALGPGAAERVCRVVFPDMVKAWGDQKKQVREAVSKALDAYLVVVPLERMLPAVIACVTDAKFPADGRRDALAWLAASAAAAPPGADWSGAFPAAAAGLADKSAEVREAAAQLATSLVTAMGPDAAGKAIRALPKPVQTALLERVGASLTQTGDVPEASSEPAPEASIAARPGTAPASASSQRGVGGTGLRASRAGPLPAAAVALARAASMATSSSGPLLMLSPPERKEERLAKLPRKALASVGGKDFAAEVRNVAVEELSGVAAPFLREDLRSRMLSDDFKKHIEVAELLEGALETQLEEVISVLDLLFRWGMLRLCELAPNTSSLLRVLDWLAMLFDALRGAGYRLRDEEAVLLLPTVLEKAGHNLPAVRERFRRLMRASCGVYPVSKIVAFLGAGLLSKNTRSRVECLEELASIVERHGVEVAERAGARVLPGVVPLAAERDATLRKSALEVLTVAYRVAGEGVWRHLGKVIDAQRDMLEAHFRKVAKDMTARGERPGLLAVNGVSAQLDDMSIGGPVRIALPQRPATAMAGTVRSPARLTSATGGLTPVNTLRASSALGLPGSAGNTPMAGGASAAASAEALAAEWARALAALPSPDESVSVSGMKTVCTCLKDLAAGLHTDDAAAMLAADADRLVATLTSLVAKVFEAAAGAPVQPAPSRACKYALNALMQTFSSVRMARAVSEPTVRAAVGELLLRLLDERVPRIEEGGQLVRALNLLMLKVLENASRTSTFVALLLMLRKPPPALAPSDVERRVRFSDLVVKCLIKLTRTLGASLAGLDVSEVLLTIHSFFMVLGVDEIRRRGAEDDRPLRMVKTVLYELTKVLGPGINAHLTKVPPPTFEPTPIIYTYIELNLQSLTTSGVVPTSGSDSPSTSVSNAALESPEGAELRTASRLAAPSPAPSTASSSGVSLSRASSSHDLKSQLAAIFRKIGDKTTTASGIEELYAFKQSQPGIDITPHLAKTSEAFQLYIQRGLAKVEAAHAGGDAGARSGALAAPAVNDAIAATQSAVEAYQERLQRVKAGLATSSSFNGSMIAAAAAAAGDAAPVAPGAAGSRQNLDALRERMRTIAAKASADPVVGAAAVAPSSAPSAASAAPPPAPPPAESAAPDAAVRASTGVSLSELQARMARIRELSQSQRQ